jgi:hypothetical protein
MPPFEEHVPYITAKPKVAPHASRERERAREGGRKAEGGREREGEGGREGGREGVSRCAVCVGGAQEEREVLTRVTQGPELKHLAGMTKD